MAIWELQTNPESDALIVTPQADLHGFDAERMGAGVEEVLRRMDEESIKNVVVDFAQTDYFCSDALGVFLKLWKQIGQRNGRLLFCGLSANEDEILRVTRLDRLWPLYPCRETALRSLHEQVLSESAS